MVSVVRLRLRQSLPLLLILVCALRPDGATGQTGALTIVINSDGSCQAAGLHVPCSEIGEKLREAGIPTDVLIGFTGARSRNYAPISGAIATSLLRAGFKNLQPIGFITGPELPPDP